MDNPVSVEPSQAERGERRVEDLHLDRVVASSAEIGPTPPDGGYGWLIVISAIIYHITVPSLLTLYGIVILKAVWTENKYDDEYKPNWRIWDMDIALVPVIMVVIRLLLESWCRAIVKIFNMPRFVALSGLCLTVAGVLLSSYSTSADSNDHIVSIFAGLFAGVGCALTGQQTEVIITHYFREKLTIAQRLVRVAPSVGHVLSPLLVGFLCNRYNEDVTVMIYGGIVMQNCFFLASFTRPVYIERVIRSTYNMIRDATEDDDEVIFSNQTPNPPESTRPTTSNPNTTEDDTTDVVVFKSRRGAREIMDPSVQVRERSMGNENRFSSDFTNMHEQNPSRFSSDFGTLDISGYARVNGYQELENIDRDIQIPQPLYRETTVDAPSNVVFAPEVTPGTARRTASLRKNFFAVINMLKDLNFYLYTLLHLCTTFSILMLGVVFPVMVWEQNPLMSVWSVCLLTSVAHAAALCFTMLCLVLPNSINEKSRLCTFFCVIGAMGFYGITVSTNKSFLVIWCMCASFSGAASSILLQPLFNSTFNEFDTTATMTTANSIVAIAVMVWSLVYNYQLKTCFFIATILQTVTASVFLVASFRRRR